MMLVLLATGCSTTAMKGTPFYTGEYSRRQGPAEDRVNVWPAFYYREPALSVLWPFFEMTDDHVAVRPLFSVYGLDRTNHQYNVLWPLAQFDRRSDDNWTFPVFWGDSHFVLFPLYWHYGEPWGNRGGSDSLFPLWILSRKENDRFSLWSPWPLVYFWSDRMDSTDGSMVLPLYWHRSDNQVSEFYSLLWSARRKENGDFWRGLLPLYFQSASGNSSSFITPLWAQGRSGAEEWKAQFPLWFYRRDASGGFDLFAPLPLVRLWSDGSGSDRGSMVLPLYWQSREGTDSRFLSFLWSGGTDQNAYWRLLLPLYFQSSNAVCSTLITPLWAQGHSRRNDWQALVPLWFRSREGTNRSSLYCPWPLAHFWSDRGGEDHGSAVFPLYWHRRQDGESQLISWLWFSQADPLWQWLAFAAAALLPGNERNRLHARYPTLGAGTLRNQRLAGGHSVVLLGSAAACPVVAAVGTLAKWRIRDVAGAVVAVMEHAQPGTRRPHVARRVRPRQLGAKTGAGLCFPNLLSGPGRGHAAFPAMAPLAE